MIQAMEPATFLLWPTGVPESNGITIPEENKDDRISNVTIPSMTVYPADASNNTGTAILICPGGGYIREAAGHEGRDIAQWFAANGITAAVLKYRLPNGHAFIPSKDAFQALQLLRSQASQWGIQPWKVGIAGFSAGGHLASTVGTLFKSPITRPDFMLLFYPVISMDSVLAHKGSRDNLLGQAVQNPDSITTYSTQLQVTDQTPPTLLLLSDDDKTVTPLNSIAFYQALKQHKIPSSLYIFPEGGHGWGYRPSFRYHEAWKKLVLEWLRNRQFIP
jgi:acetyl esterase/lipase